MCKICDLISEARTFPGSVPPSPLSPFFDMAKGPDHSAIRILTVRKGRDGSPEFGPLKLRIPSLADFANDMIVGPQTADPEKRAILQGIIREASEKAKALCGELDEKRAKAIMLENYQLAVEDYEESQREYAEDKAPSLLGGINEGTIDERMAKAIEQAKALYRALNPAPEHPFPEVAPTPEELAAQAEAAKARVVNAATETVLALKSTGQHAGATTVTIDGHTYTVSVAAHLDTPTTTGDEKAAA